MRRAFVVVAAAATLSVCKQFVPIYHFVVFFVFVFVFVFPFKFRLSHGHLCDAVQQCRRRC